MELLHYIVREKNGDRRVAGCYRRCSGVVKIWAAVILVLFIALGGLAADTAKVRLVVHQLQNAADAAALAAAHEVRDDETLCRQLAVDIALANTAAREPVIILPNFGNDPAGDVVIGYYDRMEGTFTPRLNGVNAVKVTTRRTEDSPGGSIPLLFGTVFGVDAANLSRSAIAICSGGTGAGMITLADDGTCSLRVNGNVNLDVNNGAIHVNSGDDRAVCVLGGPVTNATALYVVGDVRFTGNATFDNLLDTGVLPMPDPLCSDADNCLQGPIWDPADDLSPSGETITIEGGTHVLSPGFYSGGLKATGGDITFEPGIYIMDGAGLDISGNTNFCARGVMFYITGDGHLDLTGTGDIIITPPLMPGGVRPDDEEYDVIYDESFCDDTFSYPENMDFTYEYMSIFQDRENTNEARIVGTAAMDLQGTLYFPQAHVDIGGTSFGLGNQFIAWSAEISGEGDLLINYDGRNPAPGKRSYLVR